MEFKEIKIKPEFEGSKNPRYLSLGVVNPDIQAILQIHIYDDHGYTDSEILKDGTEYYHLNFGDKSMHVYINKDLNEMEVTPYRVDDYSMMRHLRELVLERGGTFMIPDVDNGNFQLEMSILPIPVLQQIAKEARMSVCTARTQLMVPECKSPQDYRKAIVDAISEGLELKNKLSNREVDEKTTEEIKQAIQYSINLMEDEALSSYLIKILFDNMNKKMIIENKYHESDSQLSEKDIRELAEEILRDKKRYVKQANDFVAKREQSKMQQNPGENPGSDSENR